MVDHVIERLGQGVELDREDRAQIERLCSRAKALPAKRYAIGGNAGGTLSPVVLSGWLARFQILRNGSRQITSLLLPGDIGHLHPAAVSEDDEIVTLCPSEVALVDQAELDALMQSRPNLAEALHRAEQSQMALLSSWVINVGRRNAFERMAHFICETYTRMAMIGEVEDDSFNFPLTQDDLADVLSLTPVHTNRKLQQLRREGMICLRSRQMTILDHYALRGAADFDPGYLDPQKKVPALADTAIGDPNPLYC
ncbi:MAG: Crp/Fnr family transcriptional regulator [Erythrobacter sp.]|nr:Crp/Fnr family transcriptional regulator [Erythrobacter sp.]